MKRGTMVFFGIVSSFVLLSYVSLPVFLVVFQTSMALFGTMVLWYLLFNWWLVPLCETSWLKSPKMPSVRTPQPPEFSAFGCAKVLAGRQADRLSYAFSGDDEYREIQASLKARR